MIWSVRDGAAFLKDAVHKQGWLPAINVHSFDDCDVNIRIGTYPEAINLDIVDSSHLSQPEVSDLKTKLMKIITCRALERVDDEIILCRTDIAPGERE